MNLRPPLMALSFLLLGACTSISSLQTAQTTDKGQISHTIGIGSLGSKVTTEGLTGVKGNVGENVNLPMVEYMIRYGATENVDMGFKTSGFSHAGDVKWNFYEQKSISLAVGLGLALTSAESTTANKTNKFTITDIYLPLYASYIFTPELTGYVVPKYLNRSVSGTDVSGSASFTGASLGVQWGDKKGLLLETTFLSGEGESITQYNLGFYFE